MFCTQREVTRSSAYIEILDKLRLWGLVSDAIYSYRKEIYKHTSRKDRLLLTIPEKAKIVGGKEKKPVVGTAWYGWSQRCQIASYGDFYLYTSHSCFCLHVMPFPGVSEDVSSPRSGPAYNKGRW